MHQIRSDNAEMRRSMRLLAAKRCDDIAVVGLEQAFQVDHDA